jgi:NADPH2:quinone reductase
MDRPQIIEYHEEIYKEQIMKHVTQKTMRAAALNNFGKPEIMKVQELDVPQIDPDEILIHVVSAGVGVWDPFEIEGGFAKMFGIEPQFPYVPGSDGAGIIEAVGDKVRQFKEGDRVYGISLANPKGGFYAQYTAVKAANAAHIPTNLSVEQAGVIGCDGITALQGLDDNLHLKKGASLMVFGASGGIGHLAVQLAKRMGARIFAVASGKDGVDLVKQLGADMVIEGHSEDVVKAAKNFAPKGFDAALLTAGGNAANDLVKCLRKGGRGVYPNGVEPEPEAMEGVEIKSYDGIPSPQTFDKLNHLIESGPFTVHIAKKFTLDQTVDALRALETHFLGKLAIVP